MRNLQVKDNTIRGGKAIKLLPLLVLVFFLAVSLAACTADLNKPICGWANQMPRHGSSLCDATYRTLRRVASAEAQGNDSEIRRLVPSRRVARRVIQFGRSVRRQQIDYLRTTPLLVLTERPHGRLIVLAYLIGKTSAGKIDDTETVTVQVRQGTARIVGDQPGQQW